MQLRRILRACTLAGFTMLAAREECAAQHVDAESRFRSETIELAGSPSSGATYRLNVLLPPEHDTAGPGLPVLYYLDASWWGGLLESLTRYAALASPPRMKPVILVGIAVEGDADAWNRARNRDFTPSPYRPAAPGVTMRTGNVVLDSAGTGGAREFVLFLEQQVIPTIERRYNVLAGERGIAGHSYGGLLATWVVATHPDLFRRVLAISPATYWNESEVLAAGTFGGDRSGGPDRAFIAVGGREWPIMRRSAEALAKAVEALPGVEVEHRVYEGADHLTVLPAALLDGLLHLYAR